MKPQKYWIEFEHEGETFSEVITADSFADAEQRLRAMAYGRVLGQITLTIPIPFFGRWHKVKELDGEKE